jgi:hypothetical protein
MNIQIQIFHPEYLCVICPAVLTPILTIGYFGLKKANRARTPMSAAERIYRDVANDGLQPKDVRERAKSAAEELSSRR